MSQDNFIMPREEIKLRLKKIKAVASVLALSSEAIGDGGEVTTIAALIAEWSREAEDLLKQ